MLSNSVAAAKQNFTRDLWAEARPAPTHHPHATRRPMVGGPRRVLLGAQAAAQGFLVKNASGLPYIQHCGSTEFTFSTIDLTNPAARTWTKRLIRCNMLGDQSGCDANATASAPVGGCAAAPPASPPLLSRAASSAAGACASS
jgi:hypothetical protein